MVLIRNKLKEKQDVNTILILNNLMSNFYYQVHKDIRLRFIVITQVLAIIKAVVTL